MDKIDLRPVEQQEIVIEENVQDLEPKSSASAVCVEPRTSTSLGLLNIDSIKQPNFNCDTKSLSSGWSEHELEFFTSSQKQKVEDSDLEENNADTTLSLHTDDNEDARSFLNK